MYSIEKGVKVPVKWEMRGVKYPFRKMEIGDSFLFKKEDYTKVASAMYSYQKNNPPLKFLIRELDNEQRCWRVK